MPRLKEYFITNPNQQIQENNLLINISNMTFLDIESLLSKKYMLNREIVVIKLLDYPYIDELFLDDSARPIFENMMFNLIEKYGRYNRFVYFSFKVHENNIDTLIHNGFCEWIEFWMLCFKFTHMNWVLEVNDESIHMPIEYVLCKRIDNPRLSLFVNSNNWEMLSQKMPEDIGVFTTISKHENMINNGLQYATMYINSN